MQRNTTPLAQTVNNRLADLGWQQKQLAHEWWERAGKKGKPSTFETASATR